MSGSRFTLRVLLLIAVMPWRSQAAAASPELARQLDAVVSAREPRPFQGTVLITQGDTVLYRAAQGRDGDRALTPGSQFLIASLSKQMTAALVLREVDAGRLRLDAPLQAYLPTLRAEWASEVQLQHLLNHTSGLVARDQPLKTRPGEAFAYTNLGYELLGETLERVSGKPFAALVAGLFKRCGMDDSAAPPSGTPAGLRKRFPALVAGFTEQEDGSLKAEEGLRNASANPAGGLLSTVGDLARWNACLHGGTLLKAATYEAMLRPAPGAQRSHRWGPMGYGYGLQVLEQDGLLEFSHSGYVPGYISTLIYYPRSRVSVAVLENTAWLPSNMERAFHVHDAIRQRIRVLLGEGSAAETSQP
jgi:D-alanyl-D-alanine carboxypeptidase